VDREVKALLEVAESIAKLRAPFWFSGGWAIDLHLGRVTREHHDVDVLILRQDQLGLHEALKVFRLKKIIPHPDGMPPNRGEIVEWPEGERLELPVHQINAYRAGEQEPAFQVMLGESSERDWIFRRNPEIRMPLARMGFYPLWGGAVSCAGDRAAVQGETSRAARSDRFQKRVAASQSARTPMAARGDRENASRSRMAQLALTNLEK
jgi:hypothetical protein